MHTNTDRLFQGHALSVYLAPNELYILQPDEEVRLECRGGTLWLTLDHDLRDIVLESGQRWTIPASGRCIIYALQTSEVSMMTVCKVARPKVYPGDINVSECRRDRQPLGRLEPLA